MRDAIDLSPRKRKIRKAVAIVAGLAVFVTFTAMGGVTAVLVQDVATDWEWAAWFPLVGFVLGFYLGVATYRGARMWQLPELRHQQKWLVPPPPISREEYHQAVDEILDDLR